MIDGKNKLNEKLIFQFHSSADDNILLEVDGQQYVFSKQDYINKIFNKYNETCNQDLIFILSSNNETLVFLGTDYNYWIANTRRINKIKREIDNNTKSEVKNFIYYCGIAVLENNKLEQLMYITGNKETVIEQLNEAIANLYITTTKPLEIMLNLTFDIDKFDKADLTDWYQIDKLFEWGVIK